MSSKLLKCINCQKIGAFLWHNVQNGQICFRCYEQQTQIPTLLHNNENTMEYDSNISEAKTTRKSARCTKLKQKTLSNNTNKGIIKGRNRRWILKKYQIKSPNAQAETYTCESVTYKNSFIQVGDIVSLVDNEENLYYAQIKGLLVDKFCHKFAAITWLLPTKLSPPQKEKFDPSTYVMGPEEDFLRSLSCMEFVMHTPSDYYHNKTMPNPPPDFTNVNAKQGGYVWTRVTAKKGKVLENCIDDYYM